MAKESGLFESVVVSTEDNEIAEVAKKYGAEVVKRPKELADDFTGTQEVVNHALEVIEKSGERYDYLCTIYATAPLLQKEYLEEGLSDLREHTDVCIAFSATTMPFPIWRTFKIDTSGRCEMFWPEHYKSRSQDLEEAYQDAGQFYWERIGCDLEDEPLFGKKSIPVILPRYLVQDIDTFEDWERAEKMYEILHPDRYDRWNGVKKELHKKKVIHFHWGEIYFLSIGMNVGYETYGKGEKFLRPVLVLRKLSRYAFIGIPLTSKVKEGNYFYIFSYKKGQMSTAMFHQMRVFDIRRSLYKSGNISKTDFLSLKKKLAEFMEVTP